VGLTGTTSLSALPPNTAPEMLGDFPAPPAHGTAVVPSVRGFKIADYESPRPLDRVYVAFNYFDDVNRAVNLRAGIDLHDVRVYRETFGVEKTFLDGTASLGLRLPLNSLSADSASGLGGSSTAVGDLSVIFKYALWSDGATGDVLSAGLAVTAPTGPDSFAGFDRASAPHSTVLQPFAGLLFFLGDWYVQGFSSISAATDADDVTLLFNDLGVGYFLYRSADADRLVTAVAPTLEAHVNTPLNHRGALRPDGSFGVPDLVDLTAALNVELRRWAKLTAGVAAPVTGPRPFDYEVLTHFRLLF
jgi:hypothetical protein